MPPAEPIQPYLSGATLGLAILVLIGLFLQRRENTAPAKPAAEPARPALGESEVSRADAESSNSLRCFRRRGDWLIS